MMPHPERACSTALGNTDGRRIFELLFPVVKEQLQAVSH
jgi:phosphoribosylformylglycinamidine synthase